MSAPGFNSGAEGRSTPCAGWASLEKRVKALLREARRRYKVQMKLKAECSQWAKASSAGRIGALADVLDAISAEKKAKPNDAGERQPAEPLKP